MGNPLLPRLGPPSRTCLKSVPASIDNDSPRLILSALLSFRRSTTAPAGRKRWREPVCRALRDLNLNGCGAHLGALWRCHSSAVERHLGKVEVLGSSPSGSLTL